MTQSIRSKLAHEFERRNLKLLGIVDLDVRGAYERFQAWLREGKHGSMGWLEEHDSLRADPSQFLPGARNAIVFAFNYNLGDRLLGGGGSEAPSAQGQEGTGTSIPRVAQYARLPDYHKFMKRRGQEVLEWLSREDFTKNASIGTDEPLEPGALGRVLVDSAPVFERALAAKTPKGFIGKNTCFIHPDEGSFLLLGEIITRLELPVDRPSTVDPKKREPGEGGCGTCKRCQVHCPTGALQVDYTIDSTRCLSYWTIEHRGPIPFEFWPGVAKYWYGCDICQLACPYNRDIPAFSSGDALIPRTIPPLHEVATMDQAFYEARFGGSPMTRAKRDGLRRNALIAMTVSGDPRLDETIRKIDSGGGPELSAESDVVGATLNQIRQWRDERGNGGKKAPPLGSASRGK